jgi:hypothetical protein
VLSFRRNNIPGNAGTIVASVLRFLAGGHAAEGGRAAGGTAQPGNSQPGNREPDSIH